MKTETKDLDIGGGLMSSITFIKAHFNNLLIFFSPSAVTLLSFTYGGDFIKTTSGSIFYFMVNVPLCLWVYAAITLYSSTWRSGNEISLADALLQSLKRLPSIMAVEIKVYFFSSVAILMFFIPYFYIRSIYWFSFCIASTGNSSSQTSLKRSQKLTKSHLKTVLSLDILSFIYILFTLWLVYPGTNFSQLSLQSLLFHFVNGLVALTWWQFKISLWHQMETGLGQAGQPEPPVRQKSILKMAFIGLALIPLTLISSCALMIGAGTLFKTKKGKEVYERILASTPDQAFTLSTGTRVLRPKYWVLREEKVGTGLVIEKSLASPQIVLNIRTYGLGESRETIFQKWSQENKQKLEKLSSEAPSLTKPVYEAALKNVPRADQCQWQNSDSVSVGNHVWRVEHCKLSGPQFKETPMIYFATTKSNGGQIAIVQKYVDELSPQAWAQSVTDVIQSVELQ